MPRNALTLLKQMMNESFSTYDVRCVENLVSYEHPLTHTARVTYQIHTDEMHIDFQYISSNMIVVAVINKADSKPLLVKRIAYYDYHCIKNDLLNIRDIIHTVTYESLDAKRITEELDNYFNTKTSPTTFTLVT